MPALSQEHRVVVVPDHEVWERCSAMGADLVVAATDGAPEPLHDRRDRATAVILVACGADPLQRAEALRRGADDCVEEAFELEELLIRIRLGLEVQAQRDRLTETERLAQLSTRAAGLAHEVRNPINALVNGIPALSRFLDPARGPEAERLLAVLQDSARRVDTLINRMLRSASLTGGILRDWSASRSVTSALEILRHRFDCAGVTTALSDDDRVLGRPSQLDQILINLLDNALRAVGPGGAVHVTTRTVGGGVEVQVADRGPGLQPGTHERIFEPFFSTRGVGEGTGLGLHLCREIAQHHGGTLTVASPPGEGATFRLWVPRDQQASVLADGQSR